MVAPPTTEAPVPPQDAAARFVRGPAPDWVEPVSAPEDGDSDAAAAWLLLDEQFDLRRPVRRYFRHVHRANNESGVELLSEIRIQFNPSYETLTLHGVAIVRGGARIDALEDADIDFMRIEHDMYARVYRGDYLAIIQARGLEPGDVIDYSYTIEGVNPVLGEHLIAVSSHTFPQPLARRFFRVLREAGSSVDLQSRGPAVPLETRSENGLTELRADLAALPRRDIEYWAPPEADDQVSISMLSSFRCWADVASWSATLYEVAPDDAAIAELAARCRAQAALSPELAAIAYVQERIRYVSTSFGEGGYRPRQPGLVAQRRYGDCKDKALMLVGLLRAMGHEADATLVDTQRPRGPLTAPPSPLAFNHVVVRAVIGGETYWIDATMTGQRGPLALRGRPHSMAGLLIRAGADGLTIIPPLPDSLVCERSQGVIDLSAGIGRPVLLEGDGVSIGVDAENMRRAVAVNGLNGLQRMFEDIHSQEHGDVGYELFELKDDEAANTVRLRTRLRLGDPWRRAPDGAASFRTTLCYATTLLPMAPMNGRTLPLLLLEHPLHHIHDETVLLPRGRRPIRLGAAKLKRANAGFMFTRTQTISGDKLRVWVETRTLAPALPAEQALAAVHDQAALQEAHVLDLQFKPRLMERFAARGG